MNKYQVARCFMAHSVVRLALASTSNTKTSKHRMSVFHGISPWERLKAVEKRTWKRGQSKTKMEDPMRYVNGRSWVRGRWWRDV